MPYKINFYRSILDVVISWTVILGCIYITKNVSLWFYPLAAIIIANRLLALSLVCHEGLHGTISRNKKLNDFVGRYLCAFPAHISFSKYRRIHMLHHQAVGTVNWDPDRHLYSYFPVSSGKFAWNQLKDLVTLRTMNSFLLYYTDLHELFKKRNFHPSSDIKKFLIFYFLFVGTLIATGHFRDYALFILLPLLLLTQPYVLLMGGLQHGPISEVSGEEGVSRTIRGNALYMWLLLPLDINYHGEHHLNPQIPHYHLKRYSLDLELQGKNLWKESYTDALRKLFVL